MMRKLGIVIGCLPDYASDEKRETTVLDRRDTRTECASRIRSEAYGVPRSPPHTALLQSSCPEVPQEFRLAVRLTAVQRAAMSCRSLGFSPKTRSSPKNPTRKRGAKTPIAGRPVRTGA